MCGCFLCGLLPSLLKSGYYPLCYGILDNFLSITKNSYSSRPLTRHHSYIFLIRVCDDHSATWHFYLLNTFSTSQTAVQILMKFGSYMYLSKVYQICSNQVCMTYFHQFMLMSFLAVMEYVYLQCITRNSYNFVILYECSCGGPHFWPIHKKSSIKTLTRNGSYLVWGIPRGPGF